MRPAIPRSLTTTGLAVALALGLAACAQQPAATTASATTAACLLYTSDAADE
mgnify:CR=1 FL=1